MGGFKAFLTKSNALALAIGVIIGASLGALVTTLVNAIIMPPIGWALNGIDFASIKTVLGTNAKGEEVAIGWGLFINALIVFVVVMLAAATLDDGRFVLVGGGFLGSLHLSLQIRPCAWRRRRRRRPSR